MDIGKRSGLPGINLGPRLEFRKRFLLFSVFLLISALLWFLNAMSKDYTAEIEYPLEYMDFPEGKVLVGEVPGHLDLGVSATGYSILKYKILKKPVPISFTIRNFNLNWEQTSSKAYILTSQLERQISEHLPSELRLLAINPDTLNFLFSDSESRLVRVVPDIRFSVDKQFTVLGQVGMRPDSVMVTGPVVIMDTLTAIYSEPLELGVLEKDYQDRVKLLGPGDLRIEPEEAECSIALERFTEKELSLPVEVVNLPDTIALQTFPSKITLTCRVGLSYFEQVDSHPFRAQVDFNEIDSRSELLQVSILNVPDYLIAYEYYPRGVEYLKLKR